MTLQEFVLRSKQVKNALEMVKMIYISYVLSNDFYCFLWDLWLTDAKNDVCITKCKISLQNVKVLFKKQMCFSKSAYAFWYLLEEDDVLISNMCLELKSVNVKGLKLKLKGIEYF